MAQRVYAVIDPVGVARRLAARCSSDGDCWIWTGSIDRNGYGKFKIGGRTTGAHRAAWLAYRGDIPQGLVIDHLCRVRACINPWHLDLVTGRVNTQRGHLKGAVGHREQPACAKGHPFTDANTHVYMGVDGYLHRICRICRAESHAARRARRRAAA